MISMSSKVMIDLGQPLTLPCTADANPPVSKYTWKRDGNIISHKEKFVLPNGKVRENILISAKVSFDNFFACFFI